MCKGRIGMSHEKFKKLDQKEKGRTKKKQKKLNVKINKDNKDK